MRKEIYFSPETLHSRSLVMLDGVVEFRRKHARIRIQPARSALLVLDMQDYFLNPSSHAFIPSAPPIIPGLQSLIKSFSKHRRPVIFTRHLNTDVDAGMMSDWWEDLICEDNPESVIINGLDTSQGVVINKTQYDAFYGTSLEALLRKFETRQVIITGVMTHLCCETTARSAFVRGFEVFFAVDGTATYTEAFHRGSLLSLAHGFANPLLVKEILEAFQTDEN